MTEKKQRIFITGAGGFLGSHLCDAFLERGDTVCGSLRGGDARIAHLRGNARFTTVALDFTNEDKTTDALAAFHPDGVVHAGALNPPEPILSPFPFFEANERGTVVVLEAARKAGAQKFIYISSMSIYDKTQLTPPISEEHPVSPNDFYSASKYAGEVWSRLYGESSRLRVAVLRCAGMYGPRRHSGAVGNFIARALANEPLEIERDIGWDLVYVTDIATAVVESLNFLDSRRFGIFNIGSGTETNIQELASLIIRETGSHSPVVFGADFKKTAPFHFSLDTSKARRLLQFHPTSLPVGVRQCIEFVKTTK